MLAMSLISVDLYAVLMVVGLVLAIVAVAQSGARSILAWACVVVFAALAWNAVAVT